MKEYEVRFPNEDFYTKIKIDMNDFKVINEFENEIFGIYKGVTIAVKKKKSN